MAEASSLKRKERVELPAFLRLIAGDELGCLKGVGGAAVAVTAAIETALERDLTRRALAPRAVVEVPAGPKWDGATVVQRWCVSGA